MHPILFSLGRIPIFGFSVFLIFGYLVFSFIFWRKMREEGIEEEKIFDLMFYGAIAACIGARVLYVLLHHDEFFPYILRIVAVWIAPGLSWTGAVVSALAVMITIAKKAKIRFGLLMDAFTAALPYALIIGNIGIFLDGTFVGRRTAGPIGIHYVGYEGFRHPVQLYDICTLMVILGIMAIINRKIPKKRLEYGTTAIFFLLAYSLSQWVLELFREPLLYLGSLSVYQWLMMAIYCESMGFIFVRSRQFARIRPVLRLVPIRINSGMKGAYEHITADIRRRFTKKT